MDHIDWDPQTGVGDPLLKAPLVFAGGGCVCVCLFACVRAYTCVRGACAHTCWGRTIGGLPEGPKQSLTALYQTRPNLFFTDFNQAVTNGAFGSTQSGVRGR